MLIKKIKAKASDRGNEGPVQLNGVDKQQYGIDKFFKDGILVEHLKEEAYKKFHQVEFDRLLKSNAKEEFEKFASGVKKDYKSKKNKDLCSRSQFQNFRTQIVCLPYKSLKRIANSME